MEVLVNENKYENVIRNCDQRVSSSQTEKRDVFQVEIENNNSKTVTNAQKMNAEFPLIVVMKEKSESSLTNKNSLDEQIEGSPESAVSSSTLVDPKLICKICNQSMEDPRILPCLHTFCARCILQMEPFIPTSTESSLRNRRRCRQRNSTYSWDSSNDHLGTLESTCSGSSCQSQKKTVLCPTCDAEVDLNVDAIRDLPVNFAVRRRLVDGITNEWKPSCDLCTSTLPGINNCVQCKSVLCSFCSEAHKRQKKTRDHKLVKLDEVEKDLSWENRVPLLCLEHFDEEVTFFCEDCLQTVCKICVHQSVHQKHLCLPLEDVRDVQMSKLHHLIGQLRPFIADTNDRMCQVDDSFEKLKSTIAKLSSNIGRFMEEYARAVETHRQNLLSELEKVRREKEEELILERIQLEQTLEDLESGVTFTSDLLSYASDVEILSLLGVVLKRFHELERIVLDKRPRSDEKQSGIVFSKTERVMVNRFPLAGRVSSRVPIKFLMKGEGLSCARDGQWSEVFLLCQDIDGRAATIDGDSIQAILIAKDKCSKSIAVQICDWRMGSCRLRFCPDSSGLFLLYITWQGKQIQGSPFLIPVKPKWHHHTGVFHCCSFCSSGGSKDAKCACSGSMPGGYKGCGHGHKNHPGLRHWSCCGKTVENSECSRAPSAMYTFTI